ncbi:MAG: DNA cytosine methyltransferase [Burkholderia gladioli]
MKQLRTVSLFSGCGGLDLGFHHEGFVNVGAYDINPIVIETFRQNINNAAYVADLGREMVDIPTNVDVLLAGSPCQGFSLAGKRDIHDPRNNLLVRAGEYALSVRPRVFLAENVPGALSGELKRYWASLDKLLVSNGYRTRTIEIEATQVGAAQTRRRVFLIAWTGKRDLNISIPEVANEPTLRDALKNLPRDAEHAQHTTLKSESTDIQIAECIKPGQKLSNVRRGPNTVHTWHIPGVFGRTTKAERELLDGLIGLRRRLRTRLKGDADPVSIDAIREHAGREADRLVERLIKKGYLRMINGSIDLANTFNGKYRRLAWDRPSYTVDTYFGNPRYFLHPTEHRGFSVREAARIQGFPDSFTFHGTMRENFQMIGNAVSPKVSRYLAGVIRTLLVN